MITNHPEITNAKPKARALRCRYCRETHSEVCPKVRSFEYRPDGTISKVEFWPQEVSMWQSDATMVLK